MRPVERLAVLGAGDVDRDVVAVGGRALDGLELGELLAQAVDALRRSPRRSTSGDVDGDPQAS